MSLYLDFLILFGIFSYSHHMNTDDIVQINGTYSRLEEFPELKQAISPTVLLQQ